MDYKEFFARKYGLYVEGNEGKIIKIPDHSTESSEETPNENTPFSCHTTQDFSAV